MDFAALPLFNILKAKLNYASERQSVLAQNVANADTPGYKAKDVQMPDFAKMMGGMGGQSAQNLPMARTSAGHIAPMSSTGSMKLINRKMTDELNPNGNNVVIEEEMSKIAKNQGDYTTALNLYSKTISMFKTAIGSASGGG